MSDTTISIEPGVVVVWADEKGDHVAGTVERTMPEEEQFTVFGMPGVFRIQDIRAVGVYGDEARFEVSESTGERIRHDHRLAHAEPAHAPEGESE